MQTTIWIITLFLLLTPLVGGLAIATLEKRNWGWAFWWLFIFYLVEHALIFHLVLLLLGIPGLYSQNDNAADLASGLAIIPVILIGVSGWLIGRKETKGTTRRTLSGEEARLMGVVEILMRERRG